MIYFDNSATTFPKPECVYQTLDYANRNCAFNAGRGSYEKSVEAFHIIDEFRNVVANYAQTEPKRVIITSSATESLNMIIAGLCLKANDAVYVSPFEHNAVIRPLHASGAKIVMLPFDKDDWSLDTKKLQNMFAMDNPKAVFMSHVSNVTGYVLPYQEAFKMSAAYEAINVLDCAQSFGVLKPEKEFINYVVFAGHKSMYGPFGTAGFIKYKNDVLKTTLFGGTGSDSLNLDMPSELPNKYETGSKNVVSIAGTTAGFKWVLNNDVAKHEYELVEYLLQKLKTIENVKIYLPKTMKSLGIVSISVNGYESADVASILYDEFKICVRSGYHCAPYVHDFIDSIDSKGTIRISVGYFNTKEEIDSLIDALRSM